MGDASSATVNAFCGGLGPRHFEHLAWPACPWLRDLLHSVPPTIGPAGASVGRLGGSALCHSAVIRIGSCPRLRPPREKIVT